VPLTIRLDDLTSAAVHALLEAHLATMREHSPPEAIFALDLDGLRLPEITFWSVREGETLVGCGALKALSSTHGEIKSMHTAAAHRGKGIAEAMLQHILAEAKARGITRLSLETGSQTGFAPARALYAKHGFTLSGPFGDYRENSHSAFMTRPL
jgi:putative acetyltransferase